MLPCTTSCSSVTAMNALSGYCNSSWNSLAVMGNHLLAYQVPANISYLWCFGPTLMILFILQVLTGVCLVSEPMLGVGHILMHMIMSNVGQIAPGLHAIGSTMVMAVLFCHMLRALYTCSATSVHGVFLFGILIATISIAACFLGYSTTYGAMAHWALQVVMGLVQCVPYLDTWFYGNYAVSYSMLSKCMVFHFLIVMVALVLMVLHLIMLHSTGSSAGGNLTSAPGYFHPVASPSITTNATPCSNATTVSFAYNSLVNSHQ